jgi:vacuolar-type H+-ATPase catalytic subunit A/Vma1
LLRGFGGTALLELAPYEEAAARMYPQYLAERVAEFKVYLACLLAEQALPAEALQAIAEPAVREALGDLRMSNRSDWTAVIEAFAAFDAARLRELMQRP